MQYEARKKFNDAFSDSTYHDFVKNIENSFPGCLEFRVAETPVFVPKELKNKILLACDQIITSIQQPEFKEQTRRAVPKGQNVPNETNHTSFLAIDFAICKNQAGDLVPQLIELQGFPSVFGYQQELSFRFRNHYSIPDNFQYLFNAHNKAEYINKLHHLIVGEHQDKEVVLLEIYPETQKTRIDFEITRQELGINTVCLTKLIKEDRSLYYMHNDEKIKIKRIYNRLIFDELQNYPSLKTDYNFTDDVDVEWVGHPNWFFRISKFALPFLKGDFIPETKFLNDFHGSFPLDLENYVLKPLFSFAGSGVKLNLDQEMLSSIRDPENYILQRKVKYEPVIKSPDGNVKCEIRMMYVWENKEQKPELLIALSRLSRGEMIGVRYNKDFTWVGSSAVFFETN